MSFIKENVLGDRFKVLGGIFLVLFIVLSVRLFQKQIIQSGQYKEIAQNQYLKVTELPSQRGNIFVKDLWEKEPYAVASNVHKYSVSVIPRNIKNPLDTAQKLAKVLNLNEKELFNKINNKKPYLPPIAKKIDKIKAETIASMKMVGVMILPEEYRYYPENGFMSTVLGFVDAEKQGRYGVEGFYNDELKGAVSKTSQSKLTDNINSLLTGNKSGDDIYLTIDHTVQYMAEKMLKARIDETQAESGSVLIAEPNGKILAMANSSSYNPNEFNKVDDINVFNNQSTSYVYEPGSTFKAITMSAALDQNLVQPETEGVFGASVKVRDRTIRTSTNEAYGRETMTQVLENSDNVAMVWVVYKLKQQLFSKYLSKFGFGERTGIDLQNEVGGRVYDEKNMSQVSMSTMAFGQGLSVTPLQLLNAYIALANNGKLMQPYITEKIVSPDGKTFERNPKEIAQVISSETANKITQMLISVVENGHGKKAAVPGYKVAGKTGTAQIPDLENGGYLEHQNIGSFIGYFPANNPRFVMLVKIDKPKTVAWAEESAAPLFGSLAKWLLEYYQIPSTEPIK